MLFFMDTVLSVPLNSIIVRYRAASHPKASIEDGSIPPAPTFIGMVKRVWRLQGFEGFTRGLMPTIGATFLFTLMWPFGWFKAYLSPSLQDSSHVSLFSSLLWGLIYTMFLVTTYRYIISYLTRRAITTPRKLDVLNAREALHILFSVHERKKPWAIYQIPGLLPALLLNFAFSHFILRPLRSLIFPWTDSYPPAEEAIRNVLLVLVTLLSTIVSAPLELIVTRLALQRNYGGLVFGEDSAAMNAAESGAVAVAPPSSNALHLRSENDPYLGLIDCAKKIIAEEGWPVLYRMWFLTFLGNFVLV
ncbi:mitochondrial carrier [Mycena polygramma]|nr:mitochondrial carrier [Mycena polygramma]